MVMKIDLAKLLYYLLKRIWLPILCAAIGMGAMYYYSGTRADTYTASATLYVYNANPNVVNYQYVNSSDLNTAVQLLDTYTTVIRSNKVMNAVLDQLGIPELTANYVSGTLSMSSVGNTGVLRISCTTGDPLLSQEICNAVAKIAPSEIVRVVSAGRMEVIDYADLPQAPNRRSTMRNMLLGGMAGGVLAAGLLVLLFLLNQKVNDGKELTDHYTLPLLGDLPYQRRDENTGLIISANSPSYVLAAFGKLRMNLTFAMKKKTKQLLVTSSVPGEGKSTVAANLAVSFAMDGKHVLLIDGDMRKPRQAGMFGQEDDDAGLSDLLIGEKNIEDVLKADVRPNLDLITSGTLPPNPAELLNSEEMRSFLQEAEQRYDLIVLDVPPINVVSDPLVLSDTNIGLLFVTRSHYSDHREIRKALRAAEFTDIDIMGMVLTCSRKNNAGSRYNRYYHHYDNRAKWSGRSAT